MYKYLFSLFLLLFIQKTLAQTTISGSFVHGGITRTYSYYVPASYVPGHPVPLVLGLHGTGSSGSAFAQYRDFRPIADTADFIMVHPDGSTMLGLKFWNYGNVLGSTVDDVGFLEALIDTIAAHYDINPNRVYSTGMSNGSFMTYYLACQSSRFAAIGCVTGSMSVDMYNNCTPSHPTPVIHIHDTSDPTNPYAGTSTMQGIDDVVRFWVHQNNCDTIPVVTSVPDTDPGDGATAQRYLYDNGIDGHTAELFKVNGGEHTWPGSPMPGSGDVTCMDFDAQVEIWRFFSQYERTPTGVKEQQNVQISIWPNPANHHLYLDGEKYINNISITDMQGRVVMTNQSAENIRCVNLENLQPGHYLVQIGGNDFKQVKKLVILDF